MVSASDVFDLFATAALAVVAFGFVLVFGPSPVALALALPLIVFLPGYAVVEALYPADVGDDALEFTARVGFAVALSVAVFAAVAFVAAYTVGVYPRPVVGIVASVTVFAAFVAAGRRFSLPPRQRAGVAPFSRVAGWYGRYAHGSRSLRRSAPLEAETGRDVALNLLVVVSVLVLAASVGFAALVPQGDGHSEAYLATTSGGNLTLVTSSSGLSESDRGSLVTVVENHEGHAVDYTVVTVSQQVERSANGTTTVTAEKELSRRSKRVAAGETWQTSVPKGEGDRVVVRVYEGDASGKPTLRLTLRGT